MKITKVSPLNGKVNTMELPITPDEWMNWKSGRVLIQNAMPNLTPEQREFIMTGYTPEDWEMMFPPEQDDA
jgi:hypothetical protein